MVVRLRIKDIHKVACIGSGLIGSSWATLFSKEGYLVNIYDLNREQLELSKEKVKANFKVFIDNGIMAEEDVEEAVKRISYVEDFESAVKDVDFIQECGYDHLETKKSILAEVDKYNSKALFCSSTSTLNISDISRDSKYPERCIGAHPYNPPHLMPLVEMTKWEKTDENNVKKVYEFYKSMKKEPVVLQREAPGFICNRLQFAFIREAIDIVMQGICTVEDLDKASVYGLGLRWAILGPNLNGDLNGGEKGLIEYFGPKYRPGFNVCISELATWKEIPIEYAEKIGPKGVEIEKANRSPQIGRTRNEIIPYRDKMLIELLKLHEKI